MIWLWLALMAHNVDVVATVSPSTIVGFPAAYSVTRPAISGALLAGYDWQTNPDLTLFGKGAGNACSDPPKNDSLTAAPPSGSSPYSTPHLQVISDPIWGTVIQGRYPYCTADHFYHHLVLSFTASSFVWYRQVLKVQASQYTPRGASPVAANSHKVQFLTWSGAGGRINVEWDPTSWAGTGFDQQGPSFTDSSFPTAIGDSAWTNGGGGLGTFHTDGEWREIIGNYEIRTPGADGQSLHRLWYRKISSGTGTVLDTGQGFFGRGAIHTYTGGTSPALANGFQFWGNRNRSTDQYPNGSSRPSDGSDPFFVYYGPCEVLNGSVNNNPYGLQGDGE